MLTAVRRGLLLLATVMLALGAIAGVLNREVLDGPTFASHADGIRTDDQVSQLVGEAISNRIIQIDEDLIALRPAIQAVMVQLVRSPAFTPIVEATVRQAHEAFTHAGSGQIVLRLADLTSVVVAALRTVAPAVVGNLPADLDVQLASIGAQDYADTTIRLARFVDVLAWLLPLLAVLCLVGAVWAARQRQRTLAMAGVAVAVAGAILALASGITSFLIGATDAHRLRGALGAAGWNEIGGSFRSAAVILVVAGLVMFAAAAAYLPRWSVAALGARALARLGDPGPKPWPRLVAGLLFAVLGAIALLRPAGTARLVVELVGLALLVEGIGRVAAVSAQSRAASDTDATPEAAGRDKSPRRRWVAPALAAISGIGLVGYLVVAALPSDRSIRVTAATPLTNSSACNGHTALCDRRYDQVSYVATHNSMSAADQPGWFIPEQPNGLIAQLDAGVRVLLIDTWYGQATERSGVITNAASTRGAALAEANAEYGEEVVQSALRLRSALSLTPHGPVEPYLCHALCELGSTSMLTAMTAVRGWIAAHPREVVTLIIEDNVTPPDTAEVFDRAGLLPYVHTQFVGQSWPTLGTMIDSGKRLQVFMQRQPGGSAYPWLIKAWDWIQDTPYDNPTPAALSCERLRGTETDSLFLITYILTRFATRVSDSEKINAFDALYPFATRCQRQRGRLPNFLAVDYYNKGDVFGVVDRLNGFR